MIPWRENLLALAAVGCVVLFAYWIAIHNRYAFVIDIKHGMARVRRGKVTAAFVDQVSGICGEFHVPRG